MSSLWLKVSFSMIFNFYLLMCQVCNHFLLGFPYNWEGYATSSLGEESADGGASTRISGKTENSLHFSLNDLPVTRTRDLLLSAVGNPAYNLLTENICNEILRTLGKNATKNAGPPINSDMKYNHPVGNEKSGLKATPIKCKKVNTECTIGEGVSTRSRTRMKKLCAQMKHGSH